MFFKGVKYMGSIDHSRMPDHAYTDDSYNKNQFMLSYREAIMKLSDTERNVLLLIYGQQCSIIETAKILKMKKTDVKDTRDEALKKLNKDPKMRKFEGLF